MKKKTMTKGCERSSAIKKDSRDLCEKCVDRDGSLSISSAPPINDEKRKVELGSRPMAVCACVNCVLVLDVVVSWYSKEKV